MGRHGFKRSIVTTLPIRALLFFSPLYKTNVLLTFVMTFQNNTKYNNKTWDNFIP